MPPAPKLTDDQAREIHRRRTEENPPPSWRTLADEYGVAHTVIKNAFDRVEAAAAPAENRAVAAAAPPSVVSSAPHNRIAPSPLNPRKRFDPEATERMVETVREEGILIPLLVRRANQPGNAPVGSDVDFEIIGGERRWRAGDALVNAGEWPEDMDTPIRVVDPCDDRKYLKLALAENIARKDMTPWEEAEAFDRLHQQGDSAAEIAKAVGMNKRTVEMRLRLVRDLAEPTKDALREGKITVEAANILAAFCPKLSQHLALEDIADGRFRTTADLKRALTHALIPTSVAFFPADDYKGDLITDETDPEKVYFSDAKEFERLQQKAIAEAELKATGKGYAWTKVLDNRKSEWFSTGDFVTDAKAPERGVIYEIKSSGLVVVHTDVISLAERTKEAAKAAGMLGGAAESSPITKGHFVHARNRKTVAIQAALARRPDMALRAACLALIGCGDNIRIRTEHLGGEEKIAAPSVCETIERYLLRFDVAAVNGFEITSALDVRRRGWGEYDEGKAWQVLMDMATDEVDEMFAALVALRVGSFATSMPEAGDRPAVVAMAASLGLVGHEHEHGLGLRREDLEGLRKPALLDVRSHVCPDDIVSDLNLAGLKDHLMVADKDYVLPTLRFANKATVEALFKKSLADSRQIDLEEAIAAKVHGVPVAERVKLVIAEYVDKDVNSFGTGAFLKVIGIPDKRDVLAAEISAVIGLDVTGAMLSDAQTVDDVIKVAEASTLTKATAPSGDADISVVMLRRVLSAHSVFAAKAEGETGFAEIIGEGDFPAAAADIATTFGVPTITADVLYTIEDFDHLAAVIASHRAALAAEGAGEAA